MKLHLVTRALASATVVLCAAWEARAQSAESNITKLPPVSVETSKPKAAKAKAVRPASAPSAPAPLVDQSPVPMDESAEHPAGPGDGLIAKRSRTAIKTDTAIIDTPQSISVVTREQMDQQNVHSVNDAFRYTPGVAVEQWGAVTAYDQLTIRGFNYADTGVTDTFLDGLRLTNGQLYAVPLVDPFLLERIEVLRGPASVLYGLANPGGIVALSSKLPGDEDIRLVEVEVGSRDYRRASLDLGGRLNADGSLLYRFAATTYESDGQPEGTTTERIALAPSITWRPDTRTSLTINAMYQNEPELGSIQSLPAVGTAFPNPNGRLPIDAFAGEPNHNTFERELTMIGYQFEHAINGSWSVTSRARFADVSTEFDQVMLTGLQPDLRTIDRATAVSKEEFRSFNTDTALNGRFNTGPIRHNMLFGVATEYFDGRADYGQGYASPLDIYHPTYGAAVYSPPFMYLDNEVTSRIFGVYVQDELAIGRWRSTLGVRHDWSSIETTDHLWGMSPPKQDDEATTFRAGLLYHFDNGVAPYFTYAQSFQPVTQPAVGRPPFEPTRGELYEVGIKYQPTGWNGLISAALFDLTQDNMLTADPNNPALSIQAGEITSRGVELEARLKLTDQFSFIGAYTWQDVEYTKDNSGWVGKTPLRVPSHFASGWLAWEAPSGPLSGLGAGFGVRYNGGTYGGTMAQQFQTESYTLFDAMVSYDFGKSTPSMDGIRLQINAQNLSDERYVAGCYSMNVGCFYGTGRTVTGKWSYKF